jgi:flagellar FliL protein
MQFVNRTAKLLGVLFFALSAALLSVPAQASDHGGGGGAPEPLVFTVNLGGGNYLQFGLILEAATPEAAHELVVYRPKIQHEIILLLSDKTQDKLRTLPGKKELIEEIAEAVNHVIHENKKTGVKEILFTNFIIQ